MDALIALFGNKDYNNDSPLKKLMSFFTGSDKDAHLLRNQKEMRQAFDCKGVKIAIAIGGDDAESVKKNWDFFKEEKADVCITGFFSGDCRPNFSVITSMNWDNEDSKQ